MIEITEINQIVTIEIDNFADKADLIHNHVINDVTGLQTSLDGKSNVGHTHIINDVTGLQAALDGKSNVGHTHTFSEITSKPTTLSGYGITDAISKTTTPAPISNLWRGTLAQYNAIPVKDNNTIYFIE